jgi:octopine/nopaline transport system substrate-binding protein
MISGGNWRRRYEMGCIPLLYCISNRAVRRSRDDAAGRIAAVLADATALSGTLRKPEFKDYALVGPSITRGLLGPGVGVGLRQGEADPKQRFNDAVAAAKPDRTIKKLSEKWGKIDVTPIT